MSEVKLAEKAEKVLESIEKMTVLELADLVKAIEVKFGVSAAAPVAVAAAPAAGAAAPAAAEETADEVDVILKSAGEKKIPVLKIVREITGLGLKEAKDIVDTAPQPVKTKVKKAEAADIKAKLEAEGAVVELK